MLSFEERELARQFRELAARIVVPDVPRARVGTRVPVVAIVATLIVLLVIVITVTQADERSNTASPTSPSPSATPSPTAGVLATATPSHRATPYAGLPSSTFLATPGVTYTITGIITELGPRGQTPVAGARIDVFLYASSRGGHWMSDVTEADGRYELWGIPVNATAVLYVSKGDGLVYLQPCVHQISVTRDVSHDVEIVPRSAGAEAAIAAARRGTGSFITGVVFERQADGTRVPSPNAVVAVGGDMDPLSATTIAGADGSYLLCGVPRGRIEFWGPPRQLDVTGDMTVDIEFVR